ncbi:electron transfer flavoprotein subunit alpha/FixB family protein [Salinirubellus salinus]|uniref:Electron transfer flavoprotein subunit alpha/FixB family protein n=1 Tax=Salinirubellus salinus TaxID=1364945 RepID=A0A9E7R5M6_9EURY|nr:electron transfer flavoprotein subunit alpha/FixB family protein [Salinirubellus salinus]UWM55783.1 electron transfer flavoprotein subunit alpha/FixB family protein [Salinirubellus salinus]
MTLDPTEHTIPELGPKIKDIDDVSELEEILQKEHRGENRQGAIALIQSRIDKFSEDEADDGDGEVELAGMSVADVGNAVRDIDEVADLEALLEQEEAGENRDSVKRLIESRIDSVQGSDEEEAEDAGEVEAQSPEEKYPELDHPTADKKHVRALDGGDYQDMWVYCETQQGELIDVSKEMLGKARELMDTYNDDYDTEEKVVAVVIGEDVEELAEETIAYGADVAVYADDPALSRFRLKPFTEVFCDMARGAGHEFGREDRPDEEWHDYDEPRYTVFPATNNGRDLSATVQAELDSGLASDCSDLYITESMISNPAKTGKPGEKVEFQRVFHMKRPDFSGFEYSTILCLDKPDREFHPQGASVIPGSFPLSDPDPEREGEVVHHELPLEESWLDVEVTEYDQLDGGVDLTGREVIVALGRGIGSDPTKGIELGLDLVDAFEDADLGLSRGVITASYEFDGHVAKYVTEERQIGESGQVVEPPIYIAVGISGAVQHKVGMDESDTIIAINTDTDADIVDFSDYFIEGDLFEVLPMLTEAIESGQMDIKAVADGGERIGDSRATSGPAGSDGGEPTDD